MSPTPAPSNLFGALEIISVSATTAIGGMACIDVLRPSLRIEALADPNPSCEAAVGIEMKGIFLLKPACFARSIGRPPPKPTKKSISSENDSTLSSSSIFAPLISTFCIGWLPASKYSMTLFPAISKVLVSQTISPRSGISNSAIMAGICSNTPGPVTTILGSIIERAGLVCIIFVIIMAIKKSYFPT